MPFVIYNLLKFPNIVYFVTESTTPTIWTWQRCKDIFTKDDLVSSSMTEVFVEQPLALPGSAENLVLFTHYFCHSGVQHNLVFLLS